MSQLLVSPHKRTLLTTQPLASKLALSPTVDCELFEAGGIYDADPEYTTFEAKGGMTRSEMAAAHPTYELPDQVTESGWYLGPGKETANECRARAARVAQRLIVDAKNLTEDRQLVIVAHYDFICAFLDALVMPETKGPFDHFRHYNTAITVVDIFANSGDVAFITQNAIPHILATGNSDLVSGFHL